MKALQDLTVADILTGTPEFRHVVCGLIETLAAIKKESGELAGHLSRCIRADGDGFCYDPGDEPAVKVSQLPSGAFCFEADADLSTKDT